MSDNDREPKSDAEAKDRLEKYLEKRVKELPDHLDEPLGPLAGKPENLPFSNEEDEDLSPEEIRQRFKVLKNGRHKE